MLNSNRCRLILCFLILLALILRISLSFHLGVSCTQLYKDEIQYLRLAENLIKNKSYSLDKEEPYLPTALRPPLYPLFLVIIKYIFLPLEVLLHPIFTIIQSLLSSAILILIFIFVSHLRFYNLLNLRMKLVPFEVLLPPLLYAISPSSIFFSIRYLSETLFVFLFFWAILTLFLGIKKKKKIYGIFSGILFGLATLTRSKSFYFPLFLTIIFAFFYLSIKKREVGKKPLKEVKTMLLSGINLSILSFFFAILTLFPWAIRNWYHSSKFIFTTTMTGWTLYEGNNPKAWGGPNWYSTPWPKEILILGDEVERDEFLKNKAIQWICENPLKACFLSLKKLLYFYLPLPNRPNYTTSCYLPYPYWYINAIFYGIVLLLLIVGICSCRRKKKYPHFTIEEKILIFSTFSYFTFLHIIFVVGERYREILLPFIFILLAKYLPCLRRFEEKH